LLTQTAKSIGDQNEAEEAQEHCVEFLESREDAPQSLQTPEQPFDFVTPLVHRFVGFFLGCLVGVLPGFGALIAISLLLPITYQLPATGAMIMLAGVYFVADQGGGDDGLRVDPGHRRNRRRHSGVEVFSSLPLDWEFVEAPVPTDDELHALLHTVITRLMKMLTRRGALIEEIGQTWLADPNADGEEARTLRPLQAAAITYRIAFGPRAGQQVLTLRGALAREGMARELLCSDIDGFSLHAAVRVEAHERKRLEQLCRYITRPALADERVQLNPWGQTGDLCR